MENEWGRGGEDRERGEEKVKEGGKRIREMGPRNTQEICLVDD